jgi:hypothetical protein
LGKSSLISNFVEESRLDGGRDVEEWVTNTEKSSYRVELEC